MAENDFPSPFHKERQVRGRQLLPKINGAARCRDSGEGDQPTALLATPEKDEAAIRRRTGQTQASSVTRCEITRQRCGESARGDKHAL